MRRYFLSLLGVMLLCGTGNVTAQQPNTAYLEDLPPLIDREVFFGDPEIASAQISPDGRFISFRKPHQDVMNIWVKGRDEPFEAARPITADTERPVRGYFWSQDSRYVLYVQDKGGNENFHVYAVDPRSAPERASGVPPALDLTPYGDIQARIYAVPEGTPDKIIVGLNERNRQVHDVYKLDLRTGERELVLQNDENVAGWMTDLSGTVRLGVKVGPEGGTHVLRVDGGTLTEVYSCSNEETCGPIRFHKDGTRVYMTTNKGDDVDLTRLVLFDPATGEEELVEADPEGQVDFGGAAFSDATEELVATFYVGDRVRIYPKTDEVAHDLEVLRRKLPEGEISIGSSTEDERLTIVSVTRDVDPGSTYLYDRDSEEVELLYRSRPELPGEHLAFMEPIRYRARDGLEIPAYLTVPRGADRRDLPLVVLPHGGPWARDIWGYDPYTQFLANRGYAVLQPNFRGSTGYGKMFLNAGNKEWGTGAMQHDITDGVKYLIDQGIADPARIGIFGGSYGGYATLAGLAFTPEIYAAGVSYVGPSNLLTLLNSIPPYWAPLKKMFDVRLGDPNDPEDRERLEKQSPLFSADQIRSPLLVVQGANDPRVKKAESEQIVVALRDLGREVEYLLAEDEGHGFAGSENRLAVAAAMEQFFSHYLLGRHQETMSAEISAKLAELTIDVNAVTLPEIGLAAVDAETAPLPVATGSLMEPGDMAYTTKLQAMGQEMAIEQRRTIEAASLNGKPVWRVVEVSETPMGTVVDTLEFDKTSLIPLRRHAGGAGVVQLRYNETSVTGEIGMPGQMMPIDFQLEAPVLAGGSGLEVTLAGLPLAEGYATTLRTFDPEMQRVRVFKLAVTGGETTECAAGTFETFVVKLEPLDGEEEGASTFRLMKAAPHHVVLREFKLPARMGGGMGSKELKSASSSSD
ncbi:MAG: prolyl oligopeptidase family serine peptidase [Gemmatimonadota bacterium]|nr:MAG: prolyl oligopeptidase family serine peptidase [Gemmatimonadota bacterium]